MRALWIGAAILLLLFLLMQVRLGVRGEYRAGGLTAWARLGPLRFQVFPWKKKEKSPKKPPREEKRKKEETAPEPGQPLEQRIGGALAYARTLLPIALEAGGQFRRKLRVDKLELELTVSAPDPADAALRYGQANAALGCAWGALLLVFEVKEGRAAVKLDLEAGESALYALASLSLKVGQALWLGVYFGIKALRTLLAVRRQRRREDLERKAA